MYYVKNTLDILGYNNDDPYYGFNNYYIAHNPHSELRKPWFPDFFSVCFNGTAVIIPVQYGLLMS